MNAKLPSVAICPSPRNDWLLWLSDVTESEALRIALVEPEAYYRQHRAEISLLIDLILGVVQGEPRPEPAPAQRVTRRAAPAADLEAGSLLR